MLQHERSPSSSPARKRQRLSSPFYDEQIGDISQEYLDTFDRIDFSLSQAPLKGDVGQLGSLEDGPSTDTESPFFVTGTHITGSGAEPPSKSYPSSFKVASALPRELQRALEPPCNNWLTSAPTDLPLFQSARRINVDKIQKAAPGSPEKENVGILLPSAAALANARAKLKLWEADWEDLEEAEECDSGATKPAEDLSAIEVGPPAGFPFPSGSKNKMPPPVSTPLSHTSTFTPLRPRNAMAPPTLTPASRPVFQSAGFGSQGRPFRPITFKQPSSALSSDSNTVPRSASQIPRTPLSKPSFSTPSKLGPSVLKQTPMILGSTPRSIGISKRGASAFKSPFRTPNSAPPATRFPSSNSLPKSQLQNRVYPPASKPPLSPSVKTGTLSLSASGDMQSRPPISLPPTASSSKLTLAASGLRPQNYSGEELEAMGLNVQELGQVKPATAMHYCFYSFTSASAPGPSQAEPALFNVTAAYTELMKQGCSLATEEWVTNHWCLILWKLAGMAALDPGSEKIESKRRWCWAEVVKQLRQRYVIELDGGRRPILRKIVTQDSASTVPMVLCVSAILESEDGRPILEVTDGWYRVRAEIDSALARAVKRGIIREGRKLVIVGARLNSERKDPVEILEAYNSVTLKISGNSSSLAPWHARLGVQNQRYISTLHALTPDGGLISCLDVEVTKVHPFGYIEFVEQDGRTVHVGPRNEAEEAKEMDRWNKRRDIELSKIREVHEKRVSRYMDYLSRLERKAEKSRAVRDDEEMPHYIDSYYDDLEEPPSALERLNSISAPDARWLAQLIRQNLDTEHERVGAEIEKELADTCPPRNVRNFQVIVVRDARTEKRPANRLAQLTVWDAMSLDMSESSNSGTFAVGQRFLVSNLVPTQHKAWMGHEPGAETFMATRKDSRWIKRKTLS